MSTHHDTPEGISPLDAFERMCIEIIQLEAVANAANAAIDECPPPRESRRCFDRAHALISSTAEKAAAAVVLVEGLKASVNAHVGQKT
jgi:hypothetical protein